MTLTQPVLIILAGGASSRMWPLKEKSLIRFGEESLLVTQLKRYETLGFKRVIIVGNPQNQTELESQVADFQKLQIDVVVQPEPIGMGDAILRAEPVLDIQEGEAVAIYINQIHDMVDLQLHRQMLSAYQEKPDQTYVAGAELDEYFPGGYLVVDDEQRITGIVEKPGADKRPSNLVNIVAHIHHDAQALFDAIRLEYQAAIYSDDHYERAMDALMREYTYKVIPYAGIWRALKFPWHVLDIMDYFLQQLDGQQIAESAFIANTASIVGSVYIGENAKIFPGAAVVGPAYIGANTIVGNNALVRNSMVLEHCEVGFTTEIARSYVADGCAMHACRVLDSVFSQSVNFSAGCTTANLRIDRGNVPTMIKSERIDSGRDKLGAIIGANAFLGVDVMTMPGVKIGEDAQIGPGTHVIKDVNNGQRVYVKQEIVVSDE